MLKFARPKNDLRTLITMLAMASIIITLGNSLYATWRVQREVLINNTLEYNRVYAAKLASATEIFFQQAQGQLAYSAGVLADTRDNEGVVAQQEVKRLREQTNNFNSVVYVDAGGWVKAASPESLKLKGQFLTSIATQQALAARRPLISGPLISAIGNLIVFVSYPVKSKSGEYIGFVGGTIYLTKNSILNKLLGEQFYRDGTSLYVTDAENKLLFHQNSHLIGQSFSPLVDDKMKQNNTTGSAQVKMTTGEPMLAGYAIVSTSNWTIVALKPTNTTLSPLSSLLFKVLRNAMPFALLTLFLAWILSRLIALPLWQLARKASKMDIQGVSSEINGIRSWYYEASQIKRAMLIGINLLHDKIGRLKYEVQTDPLTSLLNRRGLSMVLEYFLTTKQSFAVLALDIDHFKRVNDTWGHDMGDRVIQQIAGQLQENARQSDIVCRNGGEEFLMILPGTNEDITVELAERVRHAIASESREVVGQVTLSIGVAFWHAGQQPVEQAFKWADEALYQAKNAGRNRVVVSSQSEAGI